MKFRTQLKKSRHPRERCENPAHSTCVTFGMVVNKTESWVEAWKSPVYAFSQPNCRSCGKHSRPNNAVNGNQVPKAKTTAKVKVTRAKPKVFARECCARSVSANWLSWTSSRHTIFIPLAVEAIRMHCEKKERKVLCSLILIEGKIKAFRENMFS